MTMKSMSKGEFEDYMKPGALLLNLETEAMMGFLRRSRHGGHGGEDGKRVRMMLVVLAVDFVDGRG